jgi:uncharacterized membrane protein
VFDVQHLRQSVVLTAFVIGLSLGHTAALSAQGWPVRAVLFFSPTCPHCHQVINEDLPVIFERFGGEARVWVDQAVPAEQRAFYYITNGQLEVLLIDASRPAGGILYDRATEQFGVPRPRQGVPRLVVGDSVLVGSLEIPTQFPELIQRAAASGGLDWPSIDGLAEQIPAVPAPVAQAGQTAPDSTAPDVPTSRTDTVPEPEASPAQREDTASPRAAADSVPPVDTATAIAAGGDSEPNTTADSADERTGAPPQVVESTLDAIPREQDTVWSRFSRDPVGNGLSVVVLALMTLSVFLVSARAPTWHARESTSVLVPVLAVGGMLVAGYLSYVETSGGVAVCGPVGDCNAVQQSPYARVLGIPVGLLGLAGYVAIVAAWLMGRGTGRLATWGSFAQLVMVFIGVVFSIYLTILEPFVIGATCLWCLSSALIMTAMLWLVAGPGTLAWDGLRSHGMAETGTARR